MNSTVQEPAVRPAPPLDKVAAREKIGLGFGKLVSDGTHGTLHVLVNPIYNMTFGVSPALLSSVVFIQRLWDALLDPFWGHFSDNFRSHWGRRLPLLAAAVGPLAVLFASIWWFPRQASETHLFWHLLVTSLAFYVCHSLYSMPLGALILEATDDYHERTRLAAVTLAFGFLFQVASQWFFPLTQLAIFSDNVTGLRWVAGGCAVFFIAAGLLPVLLCRERHYRRINATQPRLPLLASLRAVRDNPDFLRLLGARFVSMFGYNAVGMLASYMNIYFVFGGDLKAGAWAYGFLGSSFQIAAILSTLFVHPWIARRLGKKRALQLAAVLLMADCLAKLVVYQPGQPWWQFVVMIGNGTSFAGLQLMSAAMLGDVADADEWRTGLRREGLFTSVLSWAEKAGNSLGSLLCGFVLVWIGFNAKLGAQAPATLALMKYCYFAAPFAGALAALFLIHRYSLDEDRAQRIKTDLALRRTRASADA
jgi:GPH family glycoside/pentoside/hexuronide:cation symporter